MNWLALLLAVLTLPVLAGLMVVFFRWFEESMTVIIAVLLATAAYAFWGAVLR